MILGLGLVAAVALLIPVGQSHRMRRGAAVIGAAAILVLVGGIGCLRSQHRDDGTYRIDTVGRLGQHVRERWHGVPVLASRAGASVVDVLTGPVPAVVLLRSRAGRPGRPVAWPPRAVP